MPRRLLRKRMSTAQTRRRTRNRRRITAIKPRWRTRGGQPPWNGRRRGSTRRTRRRERRVGGGARECGCQAGVGSTRRLRLLLGRHRPRAKTRRLQRLLHRLGPWAATGRESIHRGHRGLPRPSSGCWHQHIHANSTRQDCLPGGPLTDIQDRRQGTPHGHTRHIHIRTGHSERSMATRTPANARPQPYPDHPSFPD